MDQRIRPRKRDTTYPKLLIGQFLPILVCLDHEGQEIGVLIVIAIRLGFAKLLSLFIDEFEHESVKVVDRLEELRAGEPGNDVEQGKEEIHDVEDACVCVFFFGRDGMGVGKSVKRTKKKKKAGR